MMVKATFSSSGVDEQTRYHKHIITKEYINILKKEQLSTIEKMFFSVNRADIIFQHDNVPTQTAKLIK